MFISKSCNYILFFNVLLKIISNEDLNNKESVTYNIDKMINISNVLKVLLSIYRPAWVRSLTPISEIIPVVKKIKINPSCHFCWSGPHCETELAATSRTTFRHGTCCEKSGGVPSAGLRRPTRVAFFWKTCCEKSGVLNFGC